MPENYVGMMWAMQEKGLTEDPNKSIYQEIGNIKISDIFNVNIDFLLSTQVFSNL